MAAPDSNHCHSQELNPVLLIPLYISSQVGFNYSIGLKKRKDSLINRSLNFNYNASASNSRNEVATFVFNNMDRTVSLVDSLSTSYESRAVNQALGINYNHDSKDTRYNFGLNVRPGFIKNHDLRLKENFVNNTLNYSPNFNISRTLAKGKVLQADYGGENNNPNIYQLQPIRNSQNLQNIVVGNPNLKSSFSHRVSANYNYVHAKSNISVRTGLQANATQMEIVNHVILVPDTLNSLKQITRFENINGNYSFGGNYSFYLPFKQNKYSISQDIFAMLV
ncbi:MAG: hypothetical protein EOO61_17355 [Hymenobacter sp.]|nr:MAG: hypothetical protein EOO61_17355 [Hymenobacter sp.]